MKKLILLTVIVSVLASYSANKQIESAISNGNYDQVITDALRKLENNKDKKRKQDCIVQLKDAYYKVLEEDLHTIVHLKKDVNPEHYKTIYTIYEDLEERQHAIKRVLPLKINSKTLNIELNDYTSQILDYRYKISDYLIDQGITLLYSEDKYNARKAYGIFSYIERINPNFEEIRSLMTEVHQKGMDYVNVSIVNKTQQIIPQQLETQMVDLSTSVLNQFWTTYHTNTDATINYGFAIQFQLKRINISPERINEHQQLRERQILEDWEYQLDTNNTIAKDSLGNAIKIDKIVTIKARFFEVIKTKSVQIIADIVYTDLILNQVIDEFTIESGFVFENVFGRFREDERALSKTDRILLRQRQIQFPKDIQMVLDTGDDLKMKLKDIIGAHRLHTATIENLLF
jgi:hypothetical protein